MFEEYKKAA